MLFVVVVEKKNFISVVEQINSSELQELEQEDLDGT